MAIPTEETMEIRDTAMSCLSRGINWYTSVMGTGIRMPPALPADAGDD